MVRNHHSTGRFKGGRKGLHKLVIASLISLSPFIPGCSKNPIKPIQPNRKPIAGAVVNPTQGHAPLTVNFDASEESSDSDGFISKYIWVYEDGVIDSISGVNASYKYTNSGIYNPLLTVVDNEGARTSANLEQVVVTDAPITHVNVSGQLTDLLEGNPIQGALVIINNDTTSTNSEGNYSSEIIPGVYKVVFEKQGFRKRETSLLNLTQNINLDETMYTFEIADFFDEVVRNDRNHDGSGMSYRWTEQPKWYLNISPALGSGNEVTQEMIDNAVAIIKNKLPVFTNNFVNNPYIEIGTNPTYSEEWTTVEWRDNLPLNGLGAHSETPDPNYPGRIKRGYVAFGTYNPNLTYARSVYLTELTQVMGARNDSNLLYSIFDSSQSQIDYTENDLKLGKILYSRAPGNKYEDKDPD